MNYIFYLGYFRSFEFFVCLLVTHPLSITAATSETEFQKAAQVMWKNINLLLFRRRNYTSAIFWVIEWEKIEKGHEHLLLTQGITMCLLQRM